MKKTNDTTTSKKPGKVRGKNYGHHSGLHGDARRIQTDTNKIRRANARLRWHEKRQPFVQARKAARLARRKAKRQAAQFQLPTGA